MEPPTQLNTANPPRTRAGLPLITRTLCTLVFSLFVLFPGHGIEGFGVVYTLPFTRQWNPRSLFDIMATSACAAAALMIAATVLLYARSRSRLSNLTARVTILFSSLTLSTSMVYFLSLLNATNLFLGMITCIPYLIATCATYDQMIGPQRPPEKPLHAFPVQPPDNPITTSPSAPLRLSAPPR